MRYFRDNRSQAIQIGAVLIFGILIILLATFQAFVVPDQNEDVEFSHNQELQQQMQTTGDVITSIAGGGDGGSSTIKLGTTYPPRSIFANPGPASGRLQAADLGEVSIEYTSQSGNAPGVGEFWNGTDRTYATNGLVYKPGYNEYGDAPDTRYEHSLVYNDFGDANLPLSDQSLVADDVLTLVTLEGDYAESRVRSVSLDVRAFSSSSNTVTLGGDGEDVTVTIPTESPAVWETQLDAYDTTVDEDAGLVTVQLSGEQELRMARVGIGDATRGPADERSAYPAVTDTRAPSVTVEVRDRYNNPVRGAEVTVSGTDDGGSALSFEQRTSYVGTVDENGENEITLVSNSNGEIEIESLGAGDQLTFDGEHIDYPLENFEVRQGAGAGEGPEPAYNVNWASNQDIANLNDNIEHDDGLVLNRSQGTTAELPMETNPTADGADVSYSVSNSSVGSVDRSGQTDANGENSTTFTASENGVVTVYTSSGSDGDRFQLTVEGEEDEELDGAMSFDSLTVSPDGPGGPPNTQRVQDIAMSWTLNDQPEDGQEIFVEFDDATGFTFTDTIPNPPQSGSREYESFDGEDEMEADIEVTVILRSTGGSDIRTCTGTINHNSDELSKDAGLNCQE